MKFAFLHGYQSTVEQEKKEFLNSLGDCYTPQIDYDNSPTLVQDLIAKFKEEPLDFISGTSLGGLLSYYLGITLDIPVLTFNPAVVSIAMDRLKPEFLEEIVNGIPKQKNVIYTGLKDDTVDPKIQVEFVENLKKNGADIEQFFLAEMHHAINLDEMKVGFNKFIPLIEK